MSFNLDEYVDVAERIRMFAEKYPEGSLQGDGYFVRDVEEKIVGYHYVAKAYRTPADERPGVGTAYEPIPGKTPYTRDSEVMNAETSAWGRAIVALGFETKKIASAEEVRARQGSDGESGAGNIPAAPQNGDAGTPPPPSGNFHPPAAVQEKLNENAGRQTPVDGGSPEEVVLSFGKFAGRKLGDLVVGNAKEKGYVEWLAGEKYEPKNADARRIKGAAQTLLGQPLNVGAFAQPDDDSEAIPF